jgi:hypothetical protein
VEIVKEGNGAERLREVTAATAMVSQDPPVLETSYCVLDPGSTSMMPTPPAVAQDLVSAKHLCDELGDGAVSTVGHDVTMLLAEGFDGRASVLHRVIAIAWTARGGGDDPKLVDGRGSGSACRPRPMIRVGCWDCFQRTVPRAVM